MNGDKKTQFFTSIYNGLMRALALDDLFHLQNYNIAYIYITY